MTAVVLIAWAVASGAHWVMIGAVILAIWKPWWFLASVAAWAVAARLRGPRRAGPGDEADLLRGMAAELAAGASLRSAVVAAAERVPRLDLSAAVRLARAGLPADRIGESLREALPLNGRLSAAAFGLAATTGGRAGGIMSTLAARADDVGALARERRALTAQARLSAWVVGGAPLVLLGVMAATGRLSGLMADGAGRMVLAVGSILELAGAAAVVAMVRRSGR